MVYHGFNRVVLSKLFKVYHGLSRFVMVHPFLMTLTYLLRAESWGYSMVPTRQGIAMKSHQIQIPLCSIPSSNKNSGSQSEKFPDPLDHPIDQLSH